MRILTANICLLLIFLAGCGAPQKEQNLFNGRELGQWKVTAFHGHGGVYVKDDSIYLEKGNNLTGVTWSGKYPAMNYQITLEAMRVDGQDFFCGLTFPVGDSPCTLILGGWGGQVVGLSSLDYLDASDNETTQEIPFEKGKWYNVRLQVTPDKIQAWLDNQKIIDVTTTGKNISIRREVELSRPLGIATWRTTGAIRNISIETLSSE